MNLFKALGLVSLFLLNVSCTGSVYIHNEPVPSHKDPRSYLFDKISVKFEPGNDPLAMDLFTRTVISRSLAREVHQVQDLNKASFPILSVDLSLKMDDHLTAKAFKEFGLGFSLFLLEPVFWFDVDYVANGTITLITDKGAIGPFAAYASSTTRAKWFSLGELATLHDKAQQDTFSAVVDDLLNQVRQRVSH
ncbi:MAG: hypothetical protein RLZZ627_1572 [Pseudomonadota bacterium]|jgi:hypothetical protein